MNVEPIIPIFKSHYSIGASVLTLDPPEDDIKENAPISIFSIAKKHGLTEVYLCEKSMGGFVEAYKNSKANNVNLRYGIELLMCRDINDKSEESFKTEHKIQVWLSSTEYYSQFCKLITCANTEGFYYAPRLDEKHLDELLPPNTPITIPFYDSFVAKNLMTLGGECSFSHEKYKPTFLTENGELPFDELIKTGLTPFREKYDFLNTKTVLYYKRAHVKALLGLKCKVNRSTFAKPNLDHFSSDAFSFESYLEETQKIA